MLMSKNVNNDVSKDSPIGKARNLNTKSKTAESRPPSSDQIVADQLKLNAKNKHDYIKTNVVKCLGKMGK